MSDSPAQLTITTHNLAMGRLSTEPRRALAAWAAEHRLLRPLLACWPPLAERYAAHPWLGASDILGLQEVCLGQPAQLDALADIFRVRGHEPARHSAPESPDAAPPCRKGQLLLSRFAIAASGVLPLPRVGAARVAIWCDFEVPGLRGARGALLRIYDTHLSNRDGRDLLPLAGRRAQIDVILAHAAALEDAHPGAPCVLLGDLNTLSCPLWPPAREPALDALGEHGFRSAIAGFRATALIPYQLDWIFYRHLALAEARVIGRVHSDHLPVCARFHLV
ncbi:endonuclease/exonuclease/phosphatase family protein [Haliangium ochraceum]|uniref:Endonuclease/exonuclease/phosphatase n=1 Tax=Haliangium ochraceum (strain DSM 14365 / JCM 11303 / SMP-2) TaxID=502025 RepID=D0LNM2_HALO1|nr:endonuclease/exonuclease/phosphatase family protein [Haliangium ochraceum]ACY16927.1 Endonuclease/exonuclease/phosphatase [Haliangium ochraceum DSM 14365]